MYVYCAVSVSHLGESTTFIKMSFSIEPIGIAKMSPKIPRKYILAVIIDTYLVVVRRSGKA